MMRAQCQRQRGRLARWWHAVGREVYDNPQLFVPLATWTALLLALLFIGL